MPKIVLKDDETIDNALKRFKRECEKDGLMQEMKKREYYESPSVRRKKKAEKARRKEKRKTMLKQHRGDEH